MPTRFFRDWIVSRYLDKILEQVKIFKLSLNRIEFKIIDENKNNVDLIKITELNKVTEIKDSILNYNRSLIIKPNMPEALVGLGQSLLIKGQYIKALNLLKKGDGTISFDLKNGVSVNRL